MVGKNDKAADLGRRFLIRGMLGWLATPVLAIAAGALREIAIRPIASPWATELIGALGLVALIYIYLLWLLRKIGPGPSARERWLLGLGWMLLAVAFEFVFFGFVLGGPFETLLAAYDPRGGSLWSLVLVGILLGPPLIGGRLARR